MFNLLVADCDCPSMSPSFPDREAGPRKIRGAEHANGDCNQVGTLLSLPENRAPTFRAEMKCHDPTAVPLARIPFVSACNEPDLLLREPCLNSKCASRPALAFKAMAHGDTNGVTLAYEPKLSAAARGFVVCHSLAPPRCWQGRLVAARVQAVEVDALHSRQTEGLTGNPESTPAADSFWIPDRSLRGRRE